MEKNIIVAFENEIKSVELVVVKNVNNGKDEEKSLLGGCRRLAAQPSFVEAVRSIPTCVLPTKASNTQMAQAVYRLIPSDWKKGDTLLHWGSVENPEYTKLLNELKSLGLEKEIKAVAKRKGIKKTIKAKVEYKNLKPEDIINTLKTVYNRDGYATVKEAAEALANSFTSL